MLRLRNLSVVIQSKTILDSIDFEISSGEIFGLLGPNGSGKSTTLSVIAGLVQPSRGQVEWSEPDGAQGLSVVFQTPSLDKRLTVSQNLELTCRLFGISKLSSQELILQQLQRSGLTEHSQKKVMELSGGLKRRVDLVRALLSQPKLLVLDEPTSGLDEASFRKFWEYLLSYKAERNLTVLLATHSPQESEHCDRLAIFSKAKIVEIASAKDLKKRLSNDVVQLKFQNEFEAQKAQKSLSEKLKISMIQLHSELFINTDNGAILIPQIVDALERQVLQEVSLKNASMSDVFFKITGEELSH